ncbi:MAG: YjbQ family protein [Methanopyri archaeon]|nr:YjbQ family protein [Methanopyri archaeon]
MKVYTTTFNVKTKSRVEIVDVTDDVVGAVRESDVETGLVNVHSRHTTAAVIVNEPETGLLNDIVSVLSDLIPEGAGYEHDRIDNNADSHLRAILLGNSVTLPVVGGEPDLGTWQSVLLVELDGPRTRTLRVTVIGE